MESSIVVNLIQEYSIRSPEETILADEIKSLIALYPDTWLCRYQFELGHITISAWIVNPQKTHVLLVQHKSLGFLTQIGGHIDEEDSTIFHTLRREVAEEVGIEILEIDEKVLAISKFNVPENKKRDEPSHTHYDLCFTITVSQVSPTPREGESSIHSWINLASREMGTLEDGVRRIAQKFKTMS